MMVPWPCWMGSRRNFRASTESTPETDLPIEADTRVIHAMQNVLAIREGRLRRVVGAVLRYRAEILRGLTWNLFGYVALIALTLGVKQIILGSYWSGRVDWSYVMTDAVSGLFVLICAIVLTNTLSRGIPRPVILAV